MGGPPEMRLEDLPHIHPRRHAQRVQHDLDRRSVGQVRHVLFGQDPRDDPLVAVAARHLVAHRQLPLHGDIDLHELDHARRQFVAAADLFLLLLEQLLDDRDLPHRAALEVLEIRFEPRVVGHHLHPGDRLVRQVPKRLVTEHRAGVQQLLAAVLVVEIRRQRLPRQHLNDALLDLVVQDANLVLQVLLHQLELFGFDGLRAVVLLDPLPGEDLDADDDAVDPGRTGQRGIANVTGLLAEDRAQQLFLRRELCLTLRRHLADEDVGRLHVGTYPDNAAVVEILQEPFGHVRNVARDLLRAELRVAGLDLELLDVNRGVVVVLDHPLGHENRVLEVVTPPRHEGDQHVPPQRQLPQFGAGSIGQRLPHFHPLPVTHDRLLADAGVLVGALELREAVDVGAHVRAGVALIFAFHAHDNALGVDVVDRPRAPRADDRTGVARRDVLHPRSDERRSGPQQGHGLPLHVRAHQGAVGVVVLQERNQRCRHRHELLRRHIDEVDLSAGRQNEVAGLSRIDPLPGEHALFVDRGVGLRDDVPVLLPGREVERVRLELGGALLARLRGGILVDGILHFHDVADLELGPAGVRDEDGLADATVVDPAIRRLDEPEFIDPRVARQRRDEPDVRAFRRLDRADPSVVRRVDVAHLKARALPRQPAGPERRQSPLVRDLGQGVRLIHELRQLR